MRGIALMAAGVFLFSAVDAIGKLLTDTLRTIQIVWFRQLGLFWGVVHPAAGLLFIAATAFALC